MEPRETADARRVGDCSPHSREGCRELYLVAFADAVAEGSERNCRMMTGAFANDRCRTPPIRLEG